MKNKIILILVLSSCYAVAGVKTPAVEQVDCSKENFYKQVKTEAIKRLSKLNKDKIVHFSNELLKKAEKLELQELELGKKAQYLKILEKNFSNKVKEFEQKQKNIITCLDERDNKSQKRVQHMVSVISGMRPKSAAALLSVQDSNLSVKILAALTPQKVSKIFNSMDKEVSARLQKQYMTMQK